MTNKQSDNKMKMHEMVPLRRYLPLTLTFFVGILVSFVFFAIVKKWELENQRIEFESRSRGYANAVENNIHDYVESIKFVGDFFNNSEQVTRKEFSDFVMSAISRHPGIQAYSWNPLVLNDERAAYESLAQEEGFEDFMFTERTEEKKLVRAAQRDEYVVVYYIDPLEANRPAFGYDIASNPTRLKAINHGFDTGKLTATDRITLIQETGEQFGVVEVLRIGDVIENALKDFSDEGIDIYLYDLSAEEASSFLYFRPSHTSRMTKRYQGKEEIQKGLYWSKTFDLAGRQWQILFSPSSFYLDSQKSWQAWFVMSGSFLLTCLLALYLSRKLSYTADIEQRVKKQVQTNLELEKEITERKTAEYEVRKEKEQAQMYLDIAGVMIVAINAEQKVILINKKGCEILGYREEDIIGKNWFDNFIPDHERKRVKEVFNLLMRSELEPVEYFENQIITKNRQLRTIAWHNSFFHNEEDKITGTLSSGEDITDRKRMEEELQRGHKLESIGVLAGGIAHDFNNVLAAIMNNVYLVKHKIGHDEEVLSQLKKTEKAIVRAGNLTQQLLTFSKGGAPVMKLTSIEEVIKESSEFAVSGSNVKCEFDIAGNLWPVEVDAGQISQVIQNLIINADQSMPEGGVVSIHAENVMSGQATDLTLPKGMYVKISVKDQGMGIAEEFLSKIFDPYFSSKEMGRGLGLAISYSIIKNHKGHISVKSELKKGSTFNIYLPATKAKMYSGAPQQDAPLSGQGHVLIMDDEEMLRSSLGDILKITGYEVDSAEDGEKAVQLYERAMKSSYPFDAVILDLTVPGGVGGKEALKKLLEIDPNVKAIVSSGYANNSIMANYTEYGFRGVITKPFKSPAELNQVLNRVISGLDD
jgi:PAS domain S-box-containing protein